MKQCIFSFLVFFSSFSNTNAQELIQLMDYEGHPKLKVIKVNVGGNNYNFLFDTGAGVTLISPEVARNINKKIYGRAVGYRMLGEKVEYQKCDSVEIAIGAYRSLHNTVGVWDANKVLPPEWPTIDGVISLGSFNENCITLDLAKNTIIVESAASCKNKTGTMQLINARFANGLNGSENSIFLAINKAGRKWWLLMDSGNLDKIKVSHTTAKAWNITPVSDSGRVDIEDQTYEIAGISETVPSVIDDIIYDGVLNFDFLTRMVITISYPNHKIWVK